MSLAVSTLSKKDYVARHERPLEAAVTLAIKQAVNERAPDPIVRVGEILSGQGPTTDPTTNSTAEWTLAAFAASLGVAGGVAAALVSDSTTNQFELARSFESEEAIAERLSAGSLIEKVARVLWAGVAKLKAAEAATAEQLNTKFAADGDAFKGEMGFGGTEEFYAGDSGGFWAQGSWARLSWGWFRGCCRGWGSIFCALSDGVLTPPVLQVWRPSSARRPF